MQGKRRRSEIREAMGGEGRRQGEGDLSRGRRIQAGGGGRYILHCQDDSCHSPSCLPGQNMSWNVCRKYNPSFVHKIW